MAVEIGPEVSHYTLANPGQKIAIGIPEDHLHNKDDDEAAHNTIEQREVLDNKGRINQVPQDPGENQAQQTGND